jgi:hypothetical protein
MSSPKNASSPITTIKIMCVCGGCERWESLLDQARLLGLAPNKWDEVRNTLKCRYVSHHNRQAYGAEGKMFILPTPKKRLKMLVPPPLQQQSASSTTANVQPTIEIVATTSIGRACKKRASSNDVNDD